METLKEMQWNLISGNVYKNNKTAVVVVLFCFYRIQLDLLWNFNDLEKYLMVKNLFVKKISIF